MLITTRDLLTEVRDEADEYNVAAKSDDALIRMMNRGQRYIVSQLVRSYQEPLLARATLDTHNYSAAAGIEMPKDAFEDRLLMVWVNTPTSPIPLQQRTYRQIAAFNYGQRIAVPNMYFIRGRNVVTVPPIQATYNLLIDYVRNPDPLVLPIGSLSAWDTAASSVVVRDMDLNLISTTSDQLESYVNLVDGLTGLIIRTLQVQSLSGDQVTFRATPTYSEVFGRTVSGSIADLTPTADWYLCPASGTCVPQFGAALASFIVEYAVAEVGRALGDAQATIAKAVSDAADRYAEQQLAGRSTTKRIKNRSKVWGGIPYAGFPFTRR